MKKNNIGLLLLAGAVGAGAWFLLRKKGPKYKAGDVLQLGTGQYKVLGTTIGGPANPNTEAGKLYYILQQSGQTGSFLNLVSLTDSDPLWHKVS